MRKEDFERRPDRDCMAHTIPLASLLLLLFKHATAPKSEGVKSGRSGALTLDRLGLSCKINKCSDAGTWDPRNLTPVLPWRCRLNLE